MHLCFSTVSLSNKLEAVRGSDRLNKNECESIILYQLQQQQTRNHATQLLVASSIRRMHEMHILYHSFLS
jgi:hypothetical protein